MNKFDLKDYKNLSENKETKQQYDSMGDIRRKAEQIVARSKVVKEKVEQIWEALRNDERKKAREICDELLKEHSDRLIVLYCDVAIDEQSAVAQAFRDERGTDYAQWVEKTDVDELLEVILRRVVLPKKQYERACRIYRAMGKMDKVQEVCYQQGEEALKEHQYDKARAFFEQAGDFRDAKRQLEFLRRMPNVKAKFDAEVGNVKTYYQRKLKEALPEQMQEHARATARVHSCKYTYSEGFMFNLCIFAMMATCVLVLFDDAECNMVWPYFVWGVASMIALHLYNVWDFRLIWSTLGAFGMSCVIPFSKILAEQYLGTYWIAMIPAFVVTAIIFIRSIRRELGYRKCKRWSDAVHAIETNYLKNRQELIRTDLIARYKGEVGEAVVKHWMEDIPFYC